MLFPTVSFADSAPESAPERAQEIPPEFPPEPPPEDLPPKPSPIDLQHDYVSDKLVGFASSIDRFFGTDRNFQETNKSVFQLDVIHTMQESVTPNIGLAYKAKFDLPNAQQHLRLMLETNPDQPQNLPGATMGQQLQIQQQQTSAFRELSTPDSYGAAIRFENKEDSPLRLNADGGLKLDNLDVHPFARSSASYVWHSGLVETKLTQSLYQFNTTGLGESSLLEADHRFNDKILFRASSGATFLYVNQYFDLHQDFSIFQTLDQQESVLYQVSANGFGRPVTQFSLDGSSRPVTGVSEYVALVLYRMRLHQDWIFVELSPQLHYPQINNFQLNAQFITRLEFMFSK